MSTTPDLSDPPAPRVVHLPLIYRLAARLRGLTWPTGVVLILVGCALVALAQVVDIATTIGVAVAIVGVVMVCLWSACSLFPGGPDLPTVTMASPVIGRWRTLNSPTSKKPSHGTHALGQTFAVDLLNDPADGTKPEFPEAGAFRPPSEFPAFGTAVFAPADGEVVVARDGMRDHLSRTSWVSFGYLMVESIVRECLGVRTMLGNHVVLRTAHGYVVLAHLRRGSLQAAPGAMVSVGQQIAECGNSGNSSEPHVHVQLTDTPRLRWACGLPFRFQDVNSDTGEPLLELPPTGEPVVASG